MKKYYDIDLEKQRQALLKSVAAKPFVEKVIKKADAALTKTYPALKMSDYMLFNENGNRIIFENIYFERRNDCSAILGAYWLSGEDKYLKPLIDLVFMICDEFTWCLPAHAHLETNPSIYNIITEIDLFVSETAQLFTDISVMVGDSLPYYVNERMEYEIKRRVFEPLESRHDFWWDSTCTCNWAAVCSAGCTSALLHFGNEEEINNYMPRLYKAIDNYLKGFNDDGCCLEGYTYWGYGFGYFLVFARAVLSYTNGKVNYFENEKVKKIALFPQIIKMSESNGVSFSDATSECSGYVGEKSFLKSIYKDDIILPNLVVDSFRRQYSVRELLWFDADYKADEPKYETVFYDQSQWYIKKTEKYGFASKGGHNDEPHNHNDIGSFMIFTGDTIPLDDFGRGLYDKANFDYEVRFTLLVNSSRGHSLPVINGKHQLFGKQYCAKNVKAGDCFFSLDIEGAYEEGLINRIHRCFELKENSVILSDDFEFSDKTEGFSERLVSAIEPQIHEGYVSLGETAVAFDSKQYSATIEKESYTGIYGDEKKVYIIEFTPQSKDIKRFEVEIFISGNAKS